MPFPTDLQLDAMYERIARRFRAPDKPGPGRRLAEMMVDVKRLMKRAKIDPSGDGYSPKTGAAPGGGSGPVIHVDQDQHGPAEDVPATAVEAVAFAAVLADDRADRDRVVDDAFKAKHLLVNVLASLDALESHLSKVAEREKPAPPRDKGSCVCGRVMAPDKPDDRLRSGYGPCCYSTWNRWGRPSAAEFLHRREAGADTEGESS